MKMFILAFLAVTALLSFCAGIVMSNIILLATSICLAIAAYLVDKRHREYFDLSEMKP